MEDKLLVCDLDGTLLDENGAIDEESLEKIKRFCVDGGHFVICTGRMDSDIRYIEGKLGFKSEFRISQNGAVVYDKNEQLAYETIPKEYIPALNRIVFGMGLRTEVSNVTNRLFPSPRDPKDIAEFIDSSIVIENLENFVLEQEKNPTIYLTFGEKQQFQEIREKIEDELGKDTVNIVMTSPNSLEIFSKKVSKGQAVERIIQQLHLAQENVYTAGDAESDVSMFLVTPNSYAVQKAEAPIRKKAAFYVENVGMIIDRMYQGR
jgi:Cof subfamily protein (haloacid dehalogenase superfamily)